MKERIQSEAASGVVALVFLVLGFQIALFVFKVFDRPALDSSKDETAQSDCLHSQLRDSCQVVSGEPPVLQGGGDDTDRRSASQEKKTQNPRTSLGGYSSPDPQIRPFKEKAGERRVESFPFDPNTVSTVELVRLGLSPRQAEVIVNYRAKGGRFRRKEDFSRMYVVSDTLYQRLEPFISIPKVDLNRADSAQLVSLRGIGPYYASKIIEMREQLGGFYSENQILEITGIDEDRLSGFREDIVVDTTAIRKFNLWEVSEKELASHPYIGKRRAAAIIRFKSVYDTSLWNVEALVKDNIVTEDIVRKIVVYLKVF